MVKGVDWHMIFETKGSEEIKRLFGDWQETMVWSCLQGVMGHLYTDDLAAPESVMAILGDFCFFAGKPDEEITAYKPDWCKQDFIIMTAREEEWLSLIEKTYGANAKRVSRYAIRKEPDVFDKDKLQGIVESLDQKYTIRKIDEPLYYACKNERWSKDLVSVYDGYEEYRELGMGYVILEGTTVISGASSYSSYRNGIEIEVDTRAEYRRKGLASVCSARLILECLDRGLYPSWDAQNLWSVALSEKLGYHFDHAYTAYEITDYGGGAQKTRS